jgi:hypothetical protein
MKYFSTIKGGYVNGMRVSGVERRRLAESILKKSSFTVSDLDILNMSDKERKCLPACFRSWLPYLSPYHDAQTRLKKEETKTTTNTILSPFSEFLTTRNDFFRSLNSPDDENLSSTATVNDKSYLKASKFYESVTEKTPVRGKKGKR